MAAEELTLKEAVPRYLPDLWAEYRPQFGSPERAWQTLQAAATEPTMLQFYRHEARELVGGENDLLSSVCPILNALKVLLSEGYLIATGLHPSSPVRINIEKTLYSKFTLDFENHTIRTDKYAFEHVRITASSAWVADTLSGKLEAWLRQRRGEHGREFKKALIPVAREVFGAAVTDRLFDAAYQAVYGARRGRPRRAAG